MNIVDTLRSIISDCTTVEAMKIKIGLVTDQLQSTVEENEKLKAENAKLVEEKSKLREQLDAKAEAEKFVEAKGLLFKRRETGGYYDSAFCPRCGMPLGSRFPGFPLQCLPCKFVSSISDNDVARIIRGLP